MAEDKRQTEEFLSQLASISQSFNFISNNIKNISIELELDEGAYYNSVLNENEWIHVCGTYDGRGGTSANAGIKLYVNGDSKTTTTFDGGTYVSMENQGADLHIGKYTTYVGTGIMDELMIYNKELSATEVSKNYKHGKGKHKND